MKKKPDAKPDASADAEQVSRLQVIGFRLQRLGLASRSGALEEVVEPVGLPDYPPGAARDALASRLVRPGPNLLDAAYEARTLVRLRAMRGAPVVVRTADFDAFVAGVLPPDEASMRAFIGPAMTSVKAAKLSALDAVALATDHASNALAKGPLDRDELHAELRRKLPKGLLPYCRGCDSLHAHPSLIYAVALQARLALFPQENGPYLLARFEQWRGAEGKRKKAAAAASPDLLKRFLRAYAPATLSEFATWAGIVTSQARSAWDALEEQLVPVRVEGQTKPAFVLTDDVARLRSARADSTTVRLLTPGDPLLQLRDRDTLVPDRERQKIVWKNLAPRSVVLVGSELAGVATVKKERGALRISVDGVGKIAARTCAAVEEEAARLAQVRDCSDVRVVWSSRR